MLCWRQENLPERYGFHPKRMIKLDQQTSMMLFCRPRSLLEDCNQKSCTQVDQERAIEELGEIEFDKSLLYSDYCSAQLHSQYRSVVGQVSWLQSRTPSKACYRFSRCASSAAGPTSVDVRAVSKLVRSIRSEPCELKYGPSKGNLRLVGYPEAAYKHNADNNSQRSQAIFQS